MHLSIRVACICALACAALTSGFADDNHQQNGSILAELATSPERIVSTVPPNGDGNPYGVAFVPRGFHDGGILEPGDILVSNFNNGQGVQGTGTTIMKIAPGGKVSVFFQGADGLGLTTALGVLRAGFVLVGNLPANNGTAGQGSLLVIDRFGHLVTTLADATLLDGPWDLTVNDLGTFAQIFVSNVLNGTVTRINVFDGGGQFRVLSTTQIAHGYTFRTDPAALVVGPTGLAFNPFAGVLYVASTNDNTIFAIPSAALTNKNVVQGQVVYQDGTHLHGPLGLVLAPNGHLITSNGDAVNPGGTQNALVEFTPQGKFVAQFQVDPGAVGAAFGLAISGDDDNVRFAAVDDNTNQLDIWNVQQ
jgi:DNA-binding beta-propeller fold protein YncE